METFTVTQLLDINAQNKYQFEIIRSVLQYTKELLSNRFADRLIIYRMHLTVNGIEVGIDDLPNGDRFKDGKELYSQIISFIEATEGYIVNSLHLEYDYCAITKTEKFDGGFSFFQKLFSAYHPSYINTVTFKTVQIASCAPYTLAYTLQAGSLKNMQGRANIHLLKKQVPAWKTVDFELKARTGQMSEEVKGCVEEAVETAFTDILYAYCQSEADEDFLEEILDSIREGVYTEDGLILYDVSEYVANDDITNDINPLEETKLSDLKGALDDYCGQIEDNIDNVNPQVFVLIIPQPEGDYSIQNYTYISFEKDEEFDMVQINVTSF